MRRFLSSIGLEAAKAPPSPRETDDACGGLGSVIPRVTSDARPLWPSESAGQGNACPPAQPPAGLVAAVHAAGGAMPGGAPADATPAA